MPTQQSKTRPDELSDFQRAVEASLLAEQARAILAPGFGGADREYQMAYNALCTALGDLKRYMGLQ